MAFQLAELITLLAFLWTFGKVQADVNTKLDSRIDTLEVQQARIIEGQKYLLDMISDRLEVFEQKLNFLNASFNACLNKQND